MPNITQYPIFSKTVIEVEGEFTTFSITVEIPIGEYDLECVATYTLNDKSDSDTGPNVEIEDQLIFIESATFTHSWKGELTPQQHNLDAMTQLLNDNIQLIN